MKTISKQIMVSLLVLVSICLPDLMGQSTGQSSKKVVVMFGNSITYQGKWEDVLGRTDVVNWGLPGQTTGQLIWNIKNVLHDYPGTKIWFLEGGINDISLGVPIERVAENQKIVIDSLKRNHIIPVVQSTILKNNSPEDNKKVHDLNVLLEKYCLENKIDYIDLNVFLSAHGELIKELSTDGCHLQPKAYIPWGDAVKKVLAKYNL